MDTSDNIITIDEPVTNIITIVEPVTNIITIDELTNFTDAKIKKEELDGISLLNILSPNQSELRSKLYVWAGLGFPAAYTIYQYPIELPSVCSDGVTRQLMPYIDFCINASINDKIAELQMILIGIHIDLVISDPNIIIIAVTKL